jgi:hypothetical protein
VDDDSTKLQGHLAHRNDPNKTWKSDGSWNGVEHLAGDPKADKIETYTDSEGVLHELDGTFTDCGSDTTPPELEGTTVWYEFVDPTCDFEKGYIDSEFDPEKVSATLEGTVGPGETVTVVYRPKEGYFIKGNNVNDEGNVVATHTFGEVPKNCSTPPDKVVASSPEFVDPTCDTGAKLILPNVDSVEYTVDGKVAPESTVTVTASLPAGSEGVILKGKTSWTHTYGPAATGCNPSNPPKDNPPKADTPPKQPELPHTGANMWLAAVGALMTGLGAGLVKLTARV